MLPPSLFDIMVYIEIFISRLFIILKKKKKKKKRNKCIDILHRNYKMHITQSRL